MSRRDQSLIGLGLLIFLLSNLQLTNLQAIGFHPNLQLGFNPYLSPVFGYGLGIPYGAFALSPLRQPWLSKSLFAANFGPQYPLKQLLAAGSGFGPPLGNVLAGKLHASKFLQKLANYEHHYYQPNSLKNKLSNLKQSYSFSTPYTYNYGYKKHYGAKQLTLR